MVAILEEEKMSIVVHGDCLEELKKLEDDSVDAVITDPPYGLSNTKPQQVADVLKAWVSGDTKVVPAGKGFMGNEWDSFVPPPAVWEECMRVLKPGGHMAVFAGARTQDLMGLSIRLAGFEIRDTLGWVYGSGFPKSHDIGKAIKKHEEDSEQWDGWGTALKPAIEPIILARKPLEGTVANNVLSHGVGGLNIDACRVPSDTPIPSHHGTSGAAGVTMGKYRDYVPGSDTAASVENVQTAGRFPANVLLDEHAAKEMDKQSGNVKGVIGMKKVSGGHNFNIGEHTPQKFNKTSERIEDSGGASRFFPVFKYQAKAPKKERPVIEREDGSKIQHPTVKPVALMEWLVELITPPGGVVLDPFAGSGTTLQAALNKGFQPIGIEQDVDYIKLIEQRLQLTQEWREDKPETEAARMQEQGHTTRIVERRVSPPQITQ